MSLAILIKLENNVISDIKISAGGVAEKPLILEKFSNLMIRKDLGRGIDIAINNVENIISPISDLRGSSEYRIQSFKGALKKLEKSLTGGVQPSSIALTDEMIDQLDKYDTLLSRKQFDKALEYVRSLNLKSQKDWTEFAKTEKKPNDIPSYPRQIYKKEYEKLGIKFSIGHWLGTKKNS